MFVLVVWDSFNFVQYVDGANSNMTLIGAILDQLASNSDRTLPVLCEGSVLIWDCLHVSAGHPILRLKDANDIIGLFEACPNRTELLPHFQPASSFEAV